VYFIAHRVLNLLFVKAAGIVYGLPVVSSLSCPSVPVAGGKHTWSIVCGYVAIVPNEHLSTMLGKCVPST